MTKWDESLYFLAEALHTPVYELREKLPMSEYVGWQKFFDKRAKEQERASKGQSNNLLDSEENLLKGFVNG